MAVAGDEYRSTAPLERFREYMRRASDVHGAPPRKTTPWVSLKR